MLTANIVRKILADCFGDPQGVSIGKLIRVEPEKRLDWFREQAKRMAEMDRVESRAWTVRSEGDVVMGVYINGLGEGGNASDYFQLRFGAHRGHEALWIFDAKRRTLKNPLPAVLVTEMEQVCRLVAQVKERQEVNFLKAQKKQKIAGLQQTGLLAKLKALGQERQFAFAMSENVRDVRLSIRVKQRKRAFHFSFPKGKLGDVLDKVPGILDMLEQLDALGVHFRHETSYWRREQEEWVEPIQDSAEQT